MQGCCRFLTPNASPSLVPYQKSVNHSFARLIYSTLPSRFSPARRWCAFQPRVQSSFRGSRMLIRGTSSLLFSASDESEPSREYRGRWDQLERALDVRCADDWYQVTGPQLEKLLSESEFQGILTQSFAFILL